MKKILKHKHFIVRAEIKNKTKNPLEINEWMRNLIKKIGMNILLGPFTAYEHSPGNRGSTSIVVLTTSHASLHIWDEVDPGLLEFDLYSCSDFNINDVIEHLKFFEPVKIEYKFLDRENFLIELEHKIIENENVIVT
ncbi:MAG: S-adenosylmethionine decarboxylase [Candidatus Dojkabacteria bacterium]|nr:S-adenosylmethionine decarboxylase [Candidatus Dojkabacteria bacterium]